jgi:hypothetical protein
MTKRELLSGVDDIGADAFALLSVWLSVLFIDDNNNNKIVRFLCVFLLLLLPDPLYSYPLTPPLGLISASISNLVPSPWRAPKPLKSALKSVPLRSDNTAFKTCRALENLIPRRGTGFLDLYPFIK